MRRKHRTAAYSPMPVQAAPTRDHAKNNDTFTLSRIHIPIFPRTKSGYFQPPPKERGCPIII